MMSEGEARVLWQPADLDKGAIGQIAPMTIRQDGILVDPREIAETQVAVESEATMIATLATVAAESAEKEIGSARGQY